MRKLLLAGGILVAVVAAVLAAGLHRLKTSEPYRMAVDRALRDPKVIAKLGAPVRTDWYALGSPDELTIPLRGAKASGRLHAAPGVLDLVTMKGPGEPEVLHLIESPRPRR